MEPPRENSPSTPSRFLNNYLQQPELYSQGFQQRLPTQHPFYADNLTTPNNKYLKRSHHQSFDKNDSEREKKYDKKLDDNGDNKYLHQQHSSYDSYSDSYTTPNTLPASSASSTATGSTSQAKSNNSSSSTAASTTPASGTKNLANGKKTKGRVKIKMEYIDNKLRRYTTFSKRKTGIMKKAYELSTLTGTQVMLLVASETGHVYTFATRKLQPMITSEAGKTLIQTCLNSPDIPAPAPAADQRMSATGFEETELNYNISDMGGDPDKANDKDDITTTEDEQSCDESSNDENFISASSHENNSKTNSHQNFTQKMQTTTTTQRQFPDDKLLLQQQLQQQKMNEKYIDNQNKILLENLSNLPQNILQNLIQTGQLQLCTDDDGVTQCITIPIAITTDNTQEIITKKIPIKLLSQKIKSENE